MKPRALVRKVWKTVKDNAPAAMVVITGLGIITTSIWQGWQMSILRRNSNLEYRPFVFVGMQEQGGGPTGQSLYFQPASIYISWLDSCRAVLGLQYLVVRNAGKGPAKDVSCGAYVAPSPLPSNSRARAASRRDFSLPPGLAMEVEYQDTSASIPSECAKGLAYLHVFAEYYDMNGQRYLTDKICQLDSLPPCRKGTSMDIGVAYRTTHIK